MRLVVASCSVDYAGRLAAHLPMAVRLIMFKADGSVSIHSDDRAYKPLNWMNPPCTIRETDTGWTVENPGGETLEIGLEQVLHDSRHAFGLEPGLQKDGVESQLQAILADRPDVFGDGWRLVRREYPTDIGPVDLLFRDPDGVAVAVEVKRRAEIDAVEQLTRYLHRLSTDPLLPGPVRGVLAAQEIKPQARVLATERGIGCVRLDYDELRGLEPGVPRLF